MISRTLAAAILVLFTAQLVIAHDGGFGHSRRTIGFFVNQNQWTIEYRVKVAADEALIEFVQADTDRDGVVSTAERDRFFRQRGEQIGEHLEVVVGDRQRIRVRLERFTLGPSLTQTYLFTLLPREPIQQPVAEFSFDDQNFPHKPGSVSVVTGENVVVQPRMAIDPHHAERVPLRVAIRRNGN